MSSGPIKIILGRRFQCILSRQQSSRKRYNLIVLLRAMGSQRERFTGNFLEVGSEFAYLCTW
jgi:hypothetical protein